MIPYNCDTRSICTGPAPFDADLAPCCDEHEEEWTRNKAFSLWTDGDRPQFVRWLAATVGVNPIDIQRFLLDQASLTYPARVRIRGVLG